MKKRVARVAIMAAVAVSVGIVGFLCWNSLLRVIYGGICILGMLFGICAFAVATVRKKKSELTNIFFGLAFVAGSLFAGSFTRSLLASDAIIAESLRLVQRAEEFRKKEGRIPESASVLPPKDSSERLIAWLAGRTVQYLANPDGYFITRGEFITGETYSSYTGRWEISKI